MRIENEVKLDFKDVLIRPKRSTLKSRSQVELGREYTFRNSGQTFTGVPLIAANMDHTGTFAMAQALAKHDLMTAAHKFYDPQEWSTFAKDKKALSRTFVSCGSGDKDFKALQATLQAVDAQYICLDIANGYSQHFVDTVKRIREAFPQKTLMAGNIVTGEMVEELLIAGADIVKIGIGPGSVCTTRRMTGVGYPQLSAIIECADAAHGLKGHVCADGGCTTPGDVAKAFAAGADFVMLGGMLAGHDECLGEIFEADNGRKSMRFYGMSSAEAMKKYAGGVAKYRASEGKSVDIPYRGSVETTAQEILGGLRSACTYVGAERLKELSKRTTFVRVGQQLNEVFNNYHV